MCRTRRDTVVHRLFNCQHPKAVAARSQLTQHDCQQLKGIMRPRGGPRGQVWAWITGPPKPVPCTDFQIYATKWINGEPHDVHPDDVTFHPDLPIYVDGSCYNGTRHGLSSAGSAAVQLTSDGRADQAVWMALPGELPQTAAAGEHVAATIAIWYSRLPRSRDPVTITADCASVIRSAQQRRWAIGEKRPFAGFWRTFKEIVHAIKTKAHRSQQAAKDAGDEQNWYGNDLADRYAKKGAALFAPAAEHQKDWDTQIKRYKHLITQASHVLAAWPTFHEAVHDGAWLPANKAAKSKAAEARRSRPKTWADSEHEFAWAAGHKRHVCRNCGILAPKGTDAPRDPICPGKWGGDLWAAIKMAHPSHDLRKLVPDHDLRPTGTLRVPLQWRDRQAPTVFCTTCGAYCQVRLATLREPCKKPAKGGPTIRLDNVAKGLTPSGEYPVTAYRLGKVGGGLGGWATQPTTSHGTTIGWTVTPKWRIQGRPREPSAPEVATLSAPNIAPRANEPQPHVDPTEYDDHILRQSEEAERAAHNAMEEEDDVDLAGSQRDTVMADFLPPPPLRSPHCPATWQGKRALSPAPRTADAGQWETWPEAESSAPLPKRHRGSSPDRHDPGCTGRPPGSSHG